MNRDVIFSFYTEDLQGAFKQTFLKYTMLEVLLLINFQVVKREA